MLLRRGLLAGSFLVALSTFQGEFDFGVPQFREVLHPVLIMLAAGIGLVTARVYLGRGGALLAVLGFLLIRGLVSADGRRRVGPDHAALPALHRRGAARGGGLRPAPQRRSPVATGALAGVLIGTIGLAAEWGWSHVWMPLPWPDSLLPEAADRGLRRRPWPPGRVGGFVGGALARPMQRGPPAARRAAAAGPRWPACSPSWR